MHPRCCRPLALVPMRPDYRPFARPAGLSGLRRMLSLRPPPLSAAPRLPAPQEEEGPARSSPVQSLCPGLDPGTVQELPSV